MAKERLAIYACGGGGCNTGRRLANVVKSMDERQYKLHVVPKIAYIDTSDANTKNIEGDIYQFATSTELEQLRGSGGIRAENAKLISKYTKDILQKYPAGDFNIILHSGGGGSGSVIGPLLVKELLARGENVIVIMIGATDISKHINNTYRTLMSYMNYAQESKRPVPMFYHVQNDERQRDDLDQLILRELACLMFAFSSHHEETDYKDLENWLNYNRATPFLPDAVAMQITMGLTPEMAETITQNMGRVVSSIGFGMHGKLASFPGATTAYQKLGYENEESSKLALDDATMHISLHDGLLARRVKELEKIATELTVDTVSHVVERIQTHDADGLDEETGLIL